MQNLDLSILQKIPEPDMKVVLEIEPLAPLSMVSELPGSFYKSLKSPSKKMICGLFENVLGWHIDIADRKLIQKDLIKVRQKGVKGSEMKKGIKADIESIQSGSTYIPLLYEYFEVGLPVIPALEFYNDLWSKAYRRADADVHPKGTFNLDYKIIQLKREEPRDKDNPQKIDNGALFDFFKKHTEAYPLYYSTPTVREYVYAKGKYQIKLSIDSKLYGMLCEKLSVENIAYLGNNEGWVDIKIMEL